MLKDLWGRYLKDCIECPGEDYALRWRWKDLDDTLLIEAKQKQNKKLRGILASRQLTIKKGGDRLIWLGSNNGEYKVKDGYVELINSQQWERIEIPLHLCWDKVCLPKQECFRG